MVNIAICDNSTIDCQILQNIVAGIMKEKGVEISLVTYASGEELVKGLKNTKTQLIFLDIIMDKMSGIDVGRIIRENGYATDIVYCTSSQDFLLDSYEVFAMGYILKPYDIRQIFRVVEYFLSSRDISSTQYLTVKARSLERKIYFKDIIYAESVDKVVIFHTNRNGDIKVYGKLSDFEEQLVSPEFLRCHQSYIINMDYVVRMDESEFVTITNSLIPIRRKNRKEIKEKFYDYQSEKTIKKENY